MVVCDAPWSTMPSSVFGRACCAGDIGADAVPLHQVVRRSLPDDVDAVAAVARDDVESAGARPADRVLRRGDDLNSVAGVRRALGPGDIDADVVVLDDVIPERSPAAIPAPPNPSITSPLHGAVAGEDRQPVGEPARGDRRAVQHHDRRPVESRLRFTVQDHRHGDRRQGTEQRDRHGTARADLELDRVAGAEVAVRIRDRLAERTGARIIGIRHHEGGRRCRDVEGAGRGRRQVAAA